MTSSLVKISIKAGTEKNKDLSSKDPKKNRSILKELKEKKNPFSDSDLLGMLDDVLENKVIELPEAKRPAKVGKTYDPNYCRYHRLISHPIEKCITLKKRIMQLVKDGTLYWILMKLLKLITPPRC